MGMIHAAPLADLVIALRDNLGLRNFVETGTYLGHGTEWAANNFRSVWTIEAKEEFQLQAKQRMGTPGNVSFVLGDSAQQLDKICTGLDGPALFWLDAHAGAGYFGDEDRCPLIEEINAINASTFQHVILIDDARAFFAPPPPPFKYEKWPALDEIMRSLQQARDYHVTILNDCIICVPRLARGLVAEWCFRTRPSI